MPRRRPPPQPWSRFAPYVSAADKRKRAAQATARLAKGGRAPAPITIDGRQIATTFWGKAWCDNLEAYADFAHRLARGRSYVRAGAVVDLTIEAGRIEARVSGSELYRIEISIRALGHAPWKAIARRCAGRIGSLVGLLRGELPDEVMLTVTDRTGGLFPEPGQMELSCDCPDAAEVCKHVAATLYGIGARLDASPELLFRLRGVDPKDLVEQVAEGLAEIGATPTAALPAGVADLGALFGIDLADAPPPEDLRPKRRPPTTKPRRSKTPPKGGR